MSWNSNRTATGRRGRGLRIGRGRRRALTGDLDQPDDHQDRGQERHHQDPRHPSGAGGGAGGHPASMCVRRVAAKTLVSQSRRAAQSHPSAADEATSAGENGPVSKPLRVPTPESGHPAAYGSIGKGRRRVILLGSTGSIGTQALDVIAAHPDRFEVVGLAAGRIAARTCSPPRPPPIRPPRSPRPSRSRLEDRTRASPGERAATELVEATDADVVLNGITGSIGLEPTLAALRAGRILALANKESLVAGGSLVTAAAAPGQIVPVDSEHSALAQCLRGGAPDEVARLVVTASGGPFRGRTRGADGRRHRRAGAGPPHLGDGPGRHHQLGHPGQQGPGGDRGAPAVRHPVRPDRRRRAPAVGDPLDGHLRRRFDDRAGQPAGHEAADRARPGLAASARPGGARPATSPTPTAWTFEPVDREAFPALDLAFAAGRAGGTVPAAFNAANEEAVDAFRHGHLHFTGISDVLAAHPGRGRPRAEQPARRARRLGHGRLGPARAREIIARATTPDRGGRTVGVGTSVRAGR